MALITPQVAEDRELGCLPDVYHDAQKLVAAALPQVGG